MRLSLPPARFADCQGEGGEISKLLGVRDDTVLVVSGGDCDWSSSPLFRPAG